MTKRFSVVEVTRTPRITIASGCSISWPGMLSATASGTSARPVDPTGRRNARAETGGCDGSEGAGMGAGGAAGDAVTGSSAGTTAAQGHADLRARRRKPAKLAESRALREYVQDRLFGMVQRTDGVAVAGPQVPWIGRRHGHRADRRWGRAWSPEQISNRLRLDFARHARGPHELLYRDATHEMLPAHPGPLLHIDQPLHRPSPRRPRSSERAENPGRLRQPPEGVSLRPAPTRALPRRSRVSRRAPRRQDARPSALCCRRRASAMYPINDRRDARLARAVTDQSSLPPSRASADGETETSIRKRAGALIRASSTPFMIGPNRPRVDNRQPQPGDRSGWPYSFRSSVPMHEARI